MGIRNFHIGRTWLWWQLWLAIKPNLKCSKFAQYKAEYEEKIAIAEANIDKAVSDCNKVKAVYDRLSNEKNELSLALKSGGSAVQEIIDKTTRIEGQAGEVQTQEGVVKSAEQDRADEDDQIRTLKDEISH